jgi:hypothetical protein
MALFEWKKLNSNVSIIETKKKFFNSYYYNLKYFCPGGRIILNNPDMDMFKITDAIEHRREMNRHYNYGGSWRVTRERLKDIDPLQLADMNTIKKNYASVVKFRVEEPYVTLYAADEAVLFEIAQRHLKLWTHHISSVSKPVNENLKNLLDSGAIIVKTDVGFKYKFVCKDGTYYNKSSINTYLQQLGDQVKVSEAVWRMLGKDTTFAWGVWFYANDPSIANMLNIIEPNFVSNIHEVVVA